MSNTLTPYYLKGTIDSPEVLLDKDKGTVMLGGRSLPEDPKKFYDTIKEWLLNYSKSGLVKTKVIFQFEYINSSSSKMLVEILDLLKQIFDNEKEDLLYIEWRYQEDDIDIMEAGEDFEDWADVKFDYSSYK